MCDRMNQAGTTGLKTGGEFFTDSEGLSLFKNSGMKV